MPEVVEVLEKSQDYPGMKVLEFAFDGRQKVMIICHITGCRILWLMVELMTMIP